MAVVGPAFSGATKSSAKLFAAAKHRRRQPLGDQPRPHQRGQRLHVLLPRGPAGRRAGRGGRELHRQGPRGQDRLLPRRQERVRRGPRGRLQQDPRGAGREGHQGERPEDQGLLHASRRRSTTRTPTRSGTPATSRSWRCWPSPSRASATPSRCCRATAPTTTQYITSATPSVAEGTYLLCPCGDANVDPKAKAFADAYKAKFNKPAGTYSPESYDAANAIIAAMKSVDGEHHPREGPRGRPRGRLQGHHQAGQVHRQRRGRGQDDLRLPGQGRQARRPRHHAGARQVVARRERGTDRRPTGRGTGPARRLPAPPCPALGRLRASPRTHRCTPAWSSHPCASPASSGTSRSPGWRSAPSTRSSPSATPSSTASCS